MIGVLVSGRGTNLQALLDAGLPGRAGASAASPPKMAQPAARQTSAAPSTRSATCSSSIRLAAT